MSTVTKTPAKKSTTKKATATKVTTPQAPTFPPVPTTVLAEALPVASSKTVLVDLVTGEVVKHKPARTPSGSLSGNMRATLQAMKEGNPMSHNAIAAITGR